MKNSIDGTDDERDTADVATQMPHPTADTIYAVTDRLMKKNGVF
jgi:hypothetical protein